MFGLIGAGASLLGGILGAKSEKDKQADQNEYNKPVNIRARAEEGGFNPLLWAGQGNISTPVQSSNHFGNAIANAGLAYTSGKAQEEQLEIQKTELRQKQQTLDKLLQNATIRPKTGGLYSGNVTIPKNANSPLVGRGVATAAAKKGQAFPTARPFEPEAGSGGVDYAGNPVTNLSTPFGTWEVDARASDAEASETRYGDIVQEVVGLSNLALDVNKNVISPFRKQQKERRKKNDSAAKQREREAEQMERKKKREKVAALRKRNGGQPLVIGPQGRYKSSTLTKAQ